MLIMVAENGDLNMEYTGKKANGPRISNGPRKANSSKTAGAGSVVLWILLLKSTLSEPKRN